MSADPLGRPAVVSADPYVPGHGDRRYRVDRYDLTIRYAASNAVTARAVVTATLTATTARIELDLVGLLVTKVGVTGASARQWRHRRGRLVVRFDGDVAVGTVVTLVVDYRGSPRPVLLPVGEAGWEELTDGVLVAGQPHGAPSWFPCNDRPDDKASYRFTVTAPTRYTVVANGLLTGRSIRGGRTTWVYEQDEPMAPYLATVQIGPYVRRTWPASAAGTPVSVVHPHELAGFVDAAFAAQTAMLDAFAGMFGPYPFPSYTVVVTRDALEIPLEAQTLSTFGANYARTDWQAQRLIAHELSHQWFGNSLTASAWRDIWLHEGFACYSEWLWSEAAGGLTADRHARLHHARLRALPQDLTLADPGPKDMFDDRVYKRGALFLHALRLTIGSTAFFALLKRWTTEYRYSSVTSTMFEHTAGEVTGQNLRPIFSAWLERPRLPPLPASGSPV